MGKPVALEASAELRETRGFISIITMRPFWGLMANCTLEPPVSTPISRRHRMAPSRIIWYSRSVSGWGGGTVMESPVCTPMGSKFSMEQTMMALSARSRMTSNSNSFQPSTLSSISTSWTGERSKPRAGASQRKAGPQDHRIADAIGECDAILDVVDQLRLRRLEANLAHGVFEQQ